MRKAIGIIALIALVFVSVFFANGEVQAAEPATFVVTCDAPKADAGVGQTKELTLYYGVKDFVNLDQYENKGVNVFRAILNYDEDIFEPIEINLDKNGNYAGIKTRTKKDDLPLKGQNGWASVTYNPETKKLVVTNGSYINSEDQVLKVVLKVKPNATVGETTVTLTNIEAANPEADIYPSNRTVSTKVNVVSAISEATDPDLENGFGGFLRILPDTTVEELRAIQPLFTTVKDASGTTLNSTEYVPTGATTADSNFSYTLIAVGDLNSDGKLTAMDLSRLNALITRQGTALNDNQRRAADIRWDASLLATDLAQMQMLIVGLGDPKVSIWYGTGDKTCVPVYR